MNLLRINNPAWWDFSPAHRWGTLQNEVNRFFENPWGELARTSEFFTGWAPALELHEDKDDFTVKAELPGMKKENIDIAIEEGVLSISGERKREEKHTDAEIYRSERFYGRFNRSIVLPKPVDTDQVTASYKDGILTVRLPKTPAAKPKQIEVNVQQ